MRKLLVLAFVFIVYSSFADAAKRQSREPCDKQDTFFKHKHAYTYQYTVVTSSSFVGAVESRAGFSLSCTVTIKVPRKCKFVMELSQCQLQERQEGPEGNYQDVDGATDFLQDIERNDVIFQMNKGLIVEDSINTDSTESLQVLNMKRGLLSAMQFQILEPDAYTDHVQQRDIFGDCPTKYSFSADDGYKGHTYRNLRECNIRQIFRKQFNSFSSTIRPVSGGFMEGPISEGIYPFVSDITCDYGLTVDKQLGTVTCLQQQYFKPLAHHGTILASAMTNVSQSLVLQNTKKGKLKAVKSKGMSAVDIRFDFGDLHEAPAGKSDIETTLTALADNHVQNELAEVPGLFGEMVQMLRQASTDVLQDIRAETFSCFVDCEDLTMTFRQRYLLDGLYSCGTTACLLTILDAMDRGHTQPSQQMEFYQGLSNVEHVADDVIEKLWMFCDSREQSMCWFTLGTILSKKDIAPGTALPADSIASSVLENIQDVLEENCDAGELSISARELNTAIKTLENIGSQVIQGYSKMPTLQKHVIQCLTNKAIPKNVRRSTLQFMEDQSAWAEYGSMPESTTEALFSVLEDQTEDAVLRARSFSLLMKTTDTTIIQRLVDILKSNRNKQAASYMQSAVRTLLENDQPDLRKVKKAWIDNKSAARSVNYRYRSDMYSSKFSKAINFADFYKLPLTDYFGEQVYIEIIFDPASHVFSALQISANFFYGDEKHRLFDMDLNIHGFDTLFELLSANTGVTFEQLYAMYQKAKSAAAGDKTQFANFQKDIVNAVIKIMDAANHPTLLDYDLELDLKFQGKNVVFVSLQELMAYMRQAQQHMDAASANPPSMDHLYNGLLKHLEIDSFKTVEFVSLVKVLPTCAGFPLNMTVWLNGLNLVKNSYSVLPMPTGLQSMEAEASTDVIFENEMRGQLTVPVGLKYQSGMMMKIHAGSERHAKFSAAYQRVEDGHVSVKLNLYPIPPEKENEALLRVRGQMYLLHQKSTESVQADQNIQTDYTRCLDTKLQMLVGRSLCARIQLPDVRTSQTHAYFPLSGPFDIEVTLAKEDSVIGYTWEFEMYKNRPGYDKDTYFFNLVHNAPGNALGRHIFFNVSVNREHRIINATAGIPDVGFEYLAIYMDTRTINDVRTLDLEEFYWIDKKPILGYRLKAVSRRSSGVEDLVINTNLTMPGLSWDLTWEGNKTELPDDGKETVYHLTWKWFCSKERPLLYLLHVSPTYATQNGDVTRLGIKYINTASSTKQENSFHLEFYDSVLKASLGKDITSDGKNIRLAYETAGVETVILGEGTLSDLSSQQGLNYALNLDINGDDYNMVLSGSAQGHPADMTITADLEYTKTEEASNQVGRRKRSLKSIYNKFVQLEQEAASKLKQLTDMVAGGPTEPGSQPEGAGKENQGAGMGPGMGQLPNMIPLFPSIWDLPTWNTKLTIHSQLQPKFHEAASPGQRPDGMELVLTTDAEYPWNGGYSVVNNIFKIGKNQGTTFRYFWFWIDNEVETAYTSLDGTAILKDGEPWVVRNGGHFNVYRKHGDSFEFNLDQYGPTANMTYEILFDWDAIGHHEPLFHVLSHHSNKMVPLLNHDYKEYLTYEDGHAFHSAGFNHSMLNVSIQSDFYFRRQQKPNIMEQQVNVSLLVFGHGGSFAMKNKASEKSNSIEFESEVTMGSMPDKQLVYKTGMKDPRTIFISGAVIPAPNAPAVDLWNIDIALIETCIQQVTFSWTPVLDEKMATRIKTLPVKNALLLKSFADNVGQNMGKLPKDQTIWLIGVTPGQLIQKYIMPRLKQVGVEVSHTMANFVSLEERQAMLDSPGPPVPPRLRTLLATIAAKQADTEESEAVSVMEMARYYSLTAASYGYLALASQMVHSPAAAQALQDRQISFAWTNLYVIERYGRFPDNTEAIKHVIQWSREVFGFSKYYFTRQSPVTPSEQLAVVFGRQGNDRPIRVQTFDQTQYEIPAELAGACSYLLAADLMTRQYAVVMTPEGVSVLTNQEAVTITFDNQIYVGTAKQPSTEPTIALASQTGSVERLEDKVVVAMDVGVTLVCYTMNAADVCVIALNGNSLNNTIGLLGTSDRDKFTDQRLLSGFLASDINSFWQEYVVSGPEKCHAKSIPQIDTGPACNKDFESQCRDNFYKQYNNLYPCAQIYQSNDFKQTCGKESARCDSVAEDMCHIYRAWTGLCERTGLVKTEIDMPDACTMSIPMEVEAAADGSLDLVVVLSNHQTMLQLGNQPWKYLWEVINSDPDIWLEFDSLRLGVVVFAGGQGSPGEQVIWQGGSGQDYFSDLDTFDWSQVKGITGEGNTITDGFTAIQKAAEFPFKPTAHKMIVVLMTKEQSSGKGDNSEELLSQLTDKGIIVNVVSTYAKTSSKKVIGINWDERVITKKSGYADTKALPQNNDYTELVQETKGALWHLDALKGGRRKKVSRMVTEFIAQTKLN